MSDETKQPESKLSEEATKTSVESLIKKVKVGELLPGQPALYDGRPCVRLYFPPEYMEGLDDDQKVKIPLMSIDGKLQHKREDISALVSAVAWVEADRDAEIPPLIVKKKGENDEEAIRRSLKLPADFDLSKLPNLLKRSSAADLALDDGTKKEIDDALDGLVRKMSDGSLEVPKMEALRVSFERTANPKELVTAAASMLRLAYAFKLTPEKVNPRKIEKHEINFQSLSGVILLVTLVNADFALHYFTKVFGGKWAKHDKTVPDGFAAALAGKFEELPLTSSEGKILFGLGGPAWVLFEPESNTQVNEIKQTN